MSRRIHRGIAFHCHHDVLVEYCVDYGCRVRFIKVHKPAIERELRLRLFKIVPRPRLPKELSSAIIKCNRYRREYYSISWRPSVPNEHKSAIFAKCSHAEEELYSLICKHWDFLVRLHAELCSNCPWNGETIFSNAPIEAKITRGRKL